MSYQSALEAAGAKVLAFESFGSYQGEWLAFVEYNGERGWVQGWYGSCSGCDAFEAEFGWGAGEEGDYEARLANFGRGYLDGQLHTADELRERFKKQAEWDSDADAILSFLDGAEA